MKKKKILVADDDAAILEALQLMLEAVGYDVIVAIDGNTVIRMYEQKPDLLLLDIWMSGVDGRNICKQLKSDKQTKHIPIIIVSANKDIEQIAKEAGANDFVAKPFDMDYLLKKITMHLASK